MKLTHLASSTLVSACLIGLTGTAFGQNIITNGSFETEAPAVVSQGYGRLGSTESPTGWSFTVSDLLSYSWEESNNDSTRPKDPVSGDYINAEDGAWYIALRAYSNTGTPGAQSQADYDSIAQTVQTAANNTYTLTYSLYVMGGSGTAGSGTGDYFNVTWDGQVLSGTQVTDNQVSSGGWVTETTTIQGDGGSHSIAFNGFSQDHYVNLDNVSLVSQSVPEPSALAALGIGLAGLFIKRRK